jgi:alkanesulfonate monooxygenase SsuD/methylene tetrahydromethanopterin reductase-like flavin-dependent oxidoreductase (luciferase family)
VAARWGLTVPLNGIPLAAHEPVFREAEALGYTDFWSAESDVDPWIVLALGAAWTTRATLGTAIVGAFTRGPAIIAVGAAAMGEAAPEPMAVQGETLRVSGFKLGRPVPSRVPIYVAALQERMVRQAVRIADGVITNWLSAEDVRRVAAVVRDEAGKVGKDPERYPIICRISVCPTTDPRAREQFRRAVTAYLNVPVYRRFHQWLGRGDALAEMNAKWDAGDRRGALAAVPERAIDELAVIGTPERCREHIRRYVASGVTVPVLNFMSLETDPAPRAEESRAYLKALAP